MIIIRTKDNVKVSNHHSSIQCQDVSKTRSFKEIQILIRNSICNVTCLSWGESIKKIEDGWNIDLRNNKDLMVKIEFQLVKLINSIFPDLDDHSMQFPVNIRLIGKDRPSGYMEKPYATDYLHSDIWSGAPRDSRNFFMYVYISNDASHLRIYETSSNKLIKELTGNYKKHNINEHDLLEFNLPHKDGIFCTFDPYCLHKTIRTNSGFRISVDFRTRNQCCYTLNNQYISENDFIKTKMGNPYGLGHYWTMSSKEFKNFKNKVKYELNRAKKLSSEASRLRIKYLESLPERFVNEKY